LNGESRRSRGLTRSRAREWAVCSGVARERSSAFHSLNAFQRIDNISYNIFYISYVYI